MCFTLQRVSQATVIRNSEREAKSYRKPSEIQRTRTIIMIGRKKLKPGVASQFFTSISYLDKNLDLRHSLTSSTNFFHVAMSSLQQFFSNHHAYQT